MFDNVHKVILLKDRLSTHCGVFCNILNVQEIYSIMCPINGCDFFLIKI